MSVYRYRTPSIDKVKRILCCIFEKNYRKSGIFSLLTKCVFLGTSPGHVQVYHSCLKKYFSNSTKSLDKRFMKNNHHLDFLHGLFSASGIKTAFFHSKSG